MLAAVFETPGPPEVLHFAESPDPELHRGEILIKVEAAGVSRADILQRQGNYPPPPGASPILGLDLAGRVVRTGEGVNRFRTGDHVCALVSGGGYAEYCAAPEAQVLPVPENWSSVEAASLPENLFTVYDNLVTRARLRSSELLLVHGGASGIGSMAIMLARAVGAVPYVTAGSSAKCDFCKSLGAEGAINYRQDDFAVIFPRLTGGRGADVILDMVGGSYLDRNLDTLALEGRLAVIAVMGGNTGSLSIAKLMAKRASVMGSTLRIRSVAEKGQIAQRLREDIWPLLPSKTAIRPVIDSVFPLADARKAHERLESDAHFGKIILSV